MAKNLKNPINYSVQLDEDQKIVKEAIMNNQIVVVTGRAGSGKSLVSIQSAIDLLFKKQISKVLVTRANVETGRSLGYLPGSLDEKFDPYLEAFKENLYKCYSNKEKIDGHYKSGDISSLPVAFIRGKTIDDILVVEETQNLSKHEVLSILTRLGKNGKIVFNGDFDQTDIQDTFTGLHYLKKLSNVISEIKWFNLKNNHRSDLVSKILDFEYSNKKSE